MVIIESFNQIHIYTQDGKLQDNIGSIMESSKPGEFSAPMGLTINKSILYICDSKNHRIQSLSINQDHSFIKAWSNENLNYAGPLRHPYSICYSDEIIYVGTDIDIQIFTCDGVFLQKFGDNERGLEDGQFNDVRGLCVINHCLYVSDRVNKRIQVFREKVTR